MTTTDVLCVVAHPDDESFEVLDFADSGWDGPAPDGALVTADERVVGAVLAALERHRPSLVITMDLTGSDGHRDHAAVGQATTTAFLQWDGSAAASLYHWCLLRSLMNRWSAERAGRAGVYGEQLLGRPDDEITTTLDVRHVLDARRRAIAAHATQSSPFAGLSLELETAFLTEDHLVRVVPTWEGGPPEQTLFVGGVGDDAP